MVSVLSLSMSWAVGAAEGYVTLIKDASYSAGYGFGYAAYWSEVVDNPATRDYLVSNGRTFSTTQHEEVPAKSLTFGVVGGNKGKYRAYYGATYTGSDGLIFANGYLWTYYKSVTLEAAKFTVTSPKSEPFEFYSTGYRNGDLTFSGDMYAAKDCGIVLYAQQLYNNTAPRFMFKGVMSGYLGSIDARPLYDANGAPIPVELFFSEKASNLGGSLTLGKGTILTSAVNLSVDSLAIGEDVNINLTLGSSSIRVRNTLTIEGNKPVAIALTGAPKSGVSEVVRYGLIEMPIQSDFTADDFIITNPGTSVWP